MRAWGTRVSDAIQLQGRSQGNLAITTTGAASAAVLTEGVYDVWSDIDAYIAVGTAPAGVTATTGYFIKGGAVPMRVEFIGGAQKLGGVAGTGSGTLRWHQVA
jgi:hypothetical protein